MTTSAATTETSEEQTPEQADFTVEGMSCGSCAARVQKTLGKQDGVADAEVNFATGSARVRYQPDLVEVEQLRSAVDRIGYHLESVVPDQRERPGADAEQEQRTW